MLRNTAFEALSPDGSRLAYSPRDAFGSDDPLHPLEVLELAGGKPKSLGKADAWIWAPDGQHLAVSDFDGLSLVNVESGKRERVVDGDVGGYMRFSGDGKALVYAREGPNDERDVFVVDLSDGKTRRLTFGGHSDRPVWGGDWIVYRRFRFVNADHWPTVGELRLIRSNGSADRLFARGDEDLSRPHWGLWPLELSTDDTRLLACNSAEFSCGPVTFTVPDGKRHELSVDSEPQMIPFAWDLAPDGSEVLVEVAPFDSPAERIYAVPFEGGAARLLVKQAFDGSWAPGIPPTREDSG